VKWKRRYLISDAGLGGLGIYTFLRLKSSLVIGSEGLEKS
jgi:hypothetical protein